MFESDALLWLYLLSESPHFPSVVVLRGCLCSLSLAPCSKESCIAARWDTTHKELTPMTCTKGKKKNKKHHLLLFVMQRESVRHVWNTGALVDLQERVLMAGQNGGTFGTPALLLSLQAEALVRTDRVEAGSGESLFAGGGQQYMRSEKRSCTLGRQNQSSVQMVPGWH